MTNILEKILPNGHILHNPGTNHEWESWKDSFGNEIQDNTVIPEQDNIFHISIGIRCNCPFCNEQIEVEVSPYSRSETECPECEKTFWVDTEN